MDRIVGWSTCVGVGCKPVYILLELLYGRTINMLRRFSTSLTKGGETFIDLEHSVGAHNYHPLPVVLRRGKGVYVYDTAGKRYMDFLAAYSAVNHGHCHPKLLKTLREQSRVLTITSRAFFSNTLGEALKMMTETFGMDRAIMMNTGCEAVETSVKLARRWGYEVKGIPKDQAKVVFCEGNFWGRSLAACGSSDDPDRYHNFGPFSGLNFELVPYNNIPVLEESLKQPNVAGFVFEPIQGEAGVMIPDEGYLKSVRALCTKYNVLMIADEVQTGLGRCGQLLACDWEGVKPDVVALGKSLSGGMMPASATLARKDVMDVLVPNSHGSTYGGNPLAARLAQTALTVMKEDKYCENARTNGEQFRRDLSTAIGPVIQKIRGKGMMSAVEIDPKIGAWNFCERLAKKGLLAKPTHDHIVRLTPPLVITPEQLKKSADIIAKVAKSF